MTSSTDMKGKSVVIDEGEEILCPVPLTMYNPYQIQQEQDEHNRSEQEGKDANSQEKEPLGTRKSSVERIEKGRYEISANDEEEIREMDKVFKDSPEFEKYKSSWIPVSERLQGWSIVMCQRKNGGRKEKFYYHDSLTRQLRSKKQVFSFIRYGFLPKYNEGRSSSEAAENLVPEPKRQRSQTPKEAVEAFLAEARNNLNNYKG